MESLRHKIFYYSLVAIVLLFVCAMFFAGHSYYTLKIEERSFHPDHPLFKPSGLIGHGLGIVGLGLILIGVFSYMIRKRVKRFYRMGLLRNWLEFHIFLTVLGPLMILYHTAFKFGGLVAISFWSMVAVVISGIIGRYIYVHIPRTLEGRELSMSEMADMRKQLMQTLKESFHVGNEVTELLEKPISNQPDLEGRSIFYKLIVQDRLNRKTLRNIKLELQKYGFNPTEKSQILDLCKKELVLNRRKEILTSLHEMFRHWHVIHLPFALIMIAIAVVHIIVALLFGYRWIF